MAKGKIAKKASKKPKAAKPKAAAKKKNVGYCVLIREIAVKQPKLTGIQIGDLVEKKLGSRPAQGTLGRQVREARAAKS